MQAASALAAWAWGGAALAGTRVGAPTAGLAPPLPATHPARAPGHTLAAGLLQSVLGGGSGGSGSGSALNLGPLISAVLGNQEASAALPDLLGLLGKLGIGLPGAQ